MLLHYNVNIVYFQSTKLWYNVKRFPQTTRTGYADGHGGHSVLNQMDKEWYEDITNYLLPLYKGNREKMAHDIVTFISDPQRTDGSTVSIIVKLLIWQDKVVGSMIERRTELNMFEYMYTVYYPVLEAATSSKNA